MKKLLMLGTSLATTEMIKYAKSIGVYTIVTDYLKPEKSVGKLVSDEYWMINTADIDILEQKCIDEKVDAIACGVSEFNLEAAMELCERLNLPFYCNKNAWHFSRDKADFKKICIKHNVLVADDYNISSALTEDELKQVKYPVVVKPVDLSGNRGITYCYNRDELIAAYRYAESVSKSSKIIVERMLTGEEWYSYYAIANGEIRQISLNSMLAQPGELKNLYSLTTTITDKTERFMKEINPQIENVLRDIGCTEGVAWVQVMLDRDDKFYVIEMGYRLPGDLPDRTYPFINGFDSVKWLIDYALGKKHMINDLPSAQEHQYEKCACGYSLWTKKAGKIAKFIGFDDIVKTDGIEFYTLHQIGDEFALHRPLGVLTVEAENCDDFCRKIDKINNTVSIIDELGDDVIIRYTDFDYLRSVYNNGRNK